MSSPIGQNIPRADGRDKVTGAGVYAGDLKLPGMLYGKVLRSPFAHARIKRIDSRNAEAMPGVLAVLTRENLNVAEKLYGPYVKDQPVVALDKVRYAGDVVAAVAAVDERAAVAALAAFDIEYEEMPVVATIDDALREGAALVHERQEGRKSPDFGTGASHIVHEQSNVCFHFRYERGDADAGFAAADHVFEDTFDFPSAQHYPMEPHTSVARFDGDMLAVWSATQSPFPQRQELARIFGLPLGRVRVIVPYVGGGYGAKSGIKNEAIAAALSRMARRPVRIAYTAEETFRTMCQPRARITIKTGVKNDGTFVARQCKLYLNGGAYSNSGPSVTEKAGYRAHGPYPIPNVRTDAYTIYTNTVPAGAFRGFGAPQAAYAYDSHLEMIARRLNIDANALRLKNLLRRGDEYAAGDTPIDCDLHGALKRVANEMSRASVKFSESGIKRGRGFAAAVKDGGGTNKAAHALVKILLDGSVVYSSGSVEIGQGMRTAFLQLVANELTVPVESVQAAELDTQYTPFDKGTNASSATTVMGLAMQQAARDARAQLIAAAAGLFGVPADEVSLNEGKLSGGGKNMAIREVMRRHFGAAEGEIVGRGYFKVPKNSAVPLGYPSPFWEIGFGAAEVEIDGDTGETKLANYVSLTDAGKMINPQQCRGQDEGAAVFGIGQAFFEDLAYENGELMNGTLIEYRLPRFSDVPANFETIILEEGGGRGPHGAKGMGEGGILAVAPAVCNAVENAVGVRMQNVPLTPEKVWRAMKERGSKE
ncbi:MAG TPA: xanthine dehydrogenase family protein molybdopterin-binding subunit [Candidatus Binatia bacterium]|nr:xanthine dehydrogenase family protein molybdopterin-binding subunit [Candidatus Binatia bacterium]